MNIRIIASLCIGLVINVTSGYGQAGQREPVSRHPCPGGTGTGILDTILVTSLEQLVQISDLVIVGTVARVLPSTLIDPNEPSMPETTSLISVREGYQERCPTARTRSPFLSWEVEWNHAQWQFKIIRLSKLVRNISCF